MKNWVIFLIIITALKSYAQGFDWQISARLPFEIPRLFGGVVVNSSKISYKGSLNLTESFIECTKFESGIGSAFSFGFMMEYWQKANYALFFELKFLNAKGEMQALADSFPVLIKQIPRIVKVQNDVNFYYSYILAEFGVKYRLFETNLFAGLSFNFDLKTSSKYDLFEQVLSPPEYHFKDFSQRRKLFNGKISDLSVFAVSPKFSLGYNAVLGIGIYATPQISFEFPLYNYSSQDRLRITTLSIGISILYGI